MLFPRDSAFGLVLNRLSLPTLDSLSSTLPVPPPLSDPCFFPYPHVSMRAAAAPPCSREDDDGGGGGDDDDDKCSLPISPVDDSDSPLPSSVILPDRWDVVGVCQAMVDFSGVVNDAFLERLGLDKGSQKVVNHEDRGRVLRAMDGCSYEAAAGSSLSNSLVALARLGGHRIGGVPPLSIAMAGRVGADPLGGFYRYEGSLCLLEAFLSSTSSTVRFDPFLAGVVSKTNMLVIEGYLFELPDTIKTIGKNEAPIPVMASDVSCVEKHYDDFWEVIGEYADIVFENSEEARSLCQLSSEEGPETVTRYLSYFVPSVSVTDGQKGSYFGVKGEAIYIPPSPCIPVDTCGAGDASASGVLYGMLRGVSDLKAVGALAARVASTVVGQQGTRLGVRDEMVLAESFAQHHRVENSSMLSDNLSSL